MALKNIFALAIILFVAAACSMEDDLINKGQSAAFESTAVLSFNVDAQKTITKAGETPVDTSYMADRTDFATINNVSIILIDNASGDVFKAYDRLSVNKIGDDNFQIMFGPSANLQLKLDKNTTNKKFDVILVANAAASFSNCAHRDNVEDMVLGASDKNNNIMVGKTQIELTSHETIAQALANKVNISAHLSHLTAKIALCGFDVEFREGTLPTDVTATVELLNVNNRSRLFSAYANLVSETGATGLKLWDGETEAMPTNFVAPVFNTFANQNADAPVTMKLTLTYGDNTTKSFPIIINRPASTTPGAEFGNSTDHKYIKAGYIYQVYVHATLAGDKLDCTVKCYTMDWKYEERTVTLIPVTL